MARLGGHLGFPDALYRWAITELYSLCKHGGNDGPNGERYAPVHRQAEIARGSSDFRGFWSYGFPFLQGRLDNELRIIVTVLPAASSNCLQAVGRGQSDPELNVGLPCFATPLHHGHPGPPQR